MIALLAIPIMLLVFGGLFIMLVNFHYIAAVIIFGGISLLFIFSARRQLEKARAFRTAWTSMKAQALPDDGAWQGLWRKFLRTNAVFIAAWAGSVTFFGIYYTVFMSVIAGGASGLLLLVFLPMIIAYSAMVAIASAIFGCLFVWLFVKSSPMVAMATTSVPFIVIASMAVTMIIHLAAG
jgi:hypothetical protein